MTTTGRAPWMTKGGGFDLSKVSIDSVLRRTVIKDNNEFRDACSVLRAVYHAGREDAGIYLYGLFIHNHGNMARKEIIVKALTDVKTKESANILFKELTYIESNNVTRGYISEILECLSRYPIEIISDGFEALLKDRKWSYRMKNKFKGIIYYKEDDTEDYTEDEDTV